MDVYLVCAQADVLPNGGCTNPHWVQVPTLLPPLDITAGIAISVAIITLWAVAFVWRQL